MSIVFCIYAGLNGRRCLLRLCSEQQGRLWLEFLPAYAPKLNPVEYLWSHSLNGTTKATGFPIDLVRIDLLDGDYEISLKIMDEIDCSDALLADFTLSPANVYFEFGYGTGLGRNPTVNVVAIRS